MNEETKRRTAAGAIIGSAAVVLVAQGDLHRRSAAQVRGSKLLWRIGSTNAVVAFAYLRWGRVSREGARG